MSAPETQELAAFLAKYGDPNWPPRQKTVVEQPADTNAIDALLAALADAEKVAVGAIRIMNQAGAERDALQARIDVAVKLIDDWHTRPSSGELVLSPNAGAVRAVLLGDTAHPQTSTEEN